MGSSVSCWRKCDAPGFKLQNGKPTWNGSSRAMDTSRRLYFALTEAWYAFPSFALNALYAALVAYLWQGSRWHLAHDSKPPSRALDLLTSGWGAFSPLFSPRAGRDRSLFARLCFPWKGMFGLCRTWFQCARSGTGFQLYVARTRS